MTVRAPGGARNGSGSTKAPGATSAGDPAEAGATAVLSAVESGLSGFVETFDPARFSGDDAATLVGAFARIEHLAQAGKTLAVKRAADSDIFRRTGQRSNAEWLAAETGESMGDAFDTLKLGDNLGSQPGVEGALREGRLSQKKARLISGAVKENPEAEGDLLAGAEHDSLRTLGEKAARARAQGRSAEDERRREQRLHANRSVRTGMDPVDGMVWINGRFAPAEGARLRSALDRATDAVFRRAHRAGVSEEREAYMADALLELVGAGGVAAGRVDAEDPDPEDLEVGDGTGSVNGSEAGGCTSSGSGPVNGTEAGGGNRPVPGSGHNSDSGKGSGSGAGRAEDKEVRAGNGRVRGTCRTDTVHVRVDLDALRAGGVGPGQRCEIPGIGPISVERAKEIMGDALVRLVITDGVDVPCIVTLKRGIPAVVGAALLERDPTCAVPSCDQHHHLQIDHWKVDFAKNGPTQWWNLVRLCPHHHRLKTRGYFHLDRKPDGSWTFTVTPKGRAKGFGPVPPPDPDPDPPDPDDPTLFPHTG